MISHKMNSMNRGVTLFLLQFLIIGVLSSQNITIRGSEPQYAGKEITFYCYSDRIIFSKNELGSCIVNENGDFAIAFTSIPTLQVFADLGNYQVYLFTEPGNEYQIKLPPRVDKSIADKLNPYFREELIHLGIVNPWPDELNGKIRHFDDFFTPIFRKYALKAYLQTQFSNLDSTLRVVDDLYGKDPNIYFQCYVIYKTALLREMSSKKKRDIAIPSAEFSIPVLINNPAFGEWFIQVYRNYFQYLTRLDQEGYPLYEIINMRRSYHALSESVMKIDAFPNDTIQELILLKGLYDEYFSDEFDEMAILDVLDSLIYSTSFDYITSLAKNIKYRLTRLKVGQTPPNFELVTFEGDTVTLNDLIGKYVYLNFCTSNSYPCLNDFNLLKSLQEKYPDQLRVVTISVDKDNARMKSTIQTKDYSWIFLESGIHSKVIEEYDIRTYPTYFLIDPQGLLVISPAPGPDRDFERYFLDILRSRKVSGF